MSKALIVYGSTTGNTEMVAEKIGTIFTQKGIETVVKNVTDATVTELGNGYDVTLLGASTWGDEEIEFQPDFEPFFEEMSSAKLKDKNVALFGCGDTSYEHFCGAVDELENKIEQLEANLINIALKIDGDPDDVMSEIVEWAESIASSIQ